MAKLITKFKYIKPGNGAGSYLKYIVSPSRQNRQEKG